MKLMAYLLCVSSLLFAQGESESYLMGFTLQNYDGRSLGRGGIATISRDEEGHYFHANPALAAEIDTAVASIGFQPYAVDTYTGFIAGGVKLPKSGVVIAPQLNYITYGSEEAYDEYGNELDGIIAPFGFSFGTSAAYSWDDILLVGGTATVAYEKLTDAIGNEVDDASATAFLFDLGMLYRYKKFSAAAGVRNLGFWQGYESIYDNQWHLPTALYLSGLWNIPTSVPLGIYLETEKLFYSSLLFRGAMELGFHRNSFVLRLGSSFSVDDLKQMGNENEEYEYSKSDWQVFSWGFTVNVPIQTRKLYFDCAMGVRVDGIPPQFGFSGGMEF